jgi:hypothetical protein
MKFDLYTKVVLTTIATSLLVLVFRDTPVVTTARATEGDKPMHVVIDSFDGNFNSAAMPVNIEGIRGDAMPVINPKNSSNFSGVTPLIVTSTNWLTLNPCPTPFSSALSFQPNFWASWIVKVTVP